MPLFSRICRRGRRRRGRRFNPQRDAVLRGVRGATCTSYGRCLGAVTDFTPSSSFTQAGATNYAPNVYNPNYVFDVTVKDTPIPDIYKRNSVLLNNGVYYKPSSFAGSWVQYPTVWPIFERRRAWRGFRLTTANLYSFVGLLPGSTPAEAVYRLFVLSVTDSPYTPNPYSSAAIVMGRTQYQLRDFRGLAFSAYAKLVGLDTYFRYSPLSPQYRNGRWYGFRMINPGYAKVTIPHLPETLGFVFKNF